jgi:hypothetical protein
MPYGIQDPVYCSSTFKRNFKPPINEHHEACIAIHSRCSHSLSPRSFGAPLTLADGILTKLNLEEKRMQLGSNSPPDLSDTILRLRYRWFALFWKVICLDLSGQDAAPFFKSDVVLPVAVMTNPRAGSTLSDNNFQDATSDSILESVLRTDY